MVNKMADGWHPPNTDTNKPIPIPIAFLRKCDMKLIETSRKAIKAIL